MKFFHLIFSTLLCVGIIYSATKTIDTIKQDAINQASSSLQLTRDIRIAQLESEVKTIYSEIRFWADSYPVKEGMSQILTAWSSLSNNPRRSARKLYITENPLYPNYTADYFNADDGSSYSDSHEKMHTLLRGLTKIRGYYDVFLIANNGDIIYTVYKEDDYATNLLTGKYKETTLGQGFRAVHENTNLNHVSLFDFIPYAPSNNASSSFIQTSIIDSNNKTLGILAFQLPTKPIDTILNNIENDDKNITIMAVGSDYLLRNHIDKEFIKEKEEYKTIAKALNDKTGIDLLVDNKGKRTLTAYAPFNFSQNILGNTNKNTWAIIVKQDIAEILKPVEADIKKWLIILITLGLLSLLFAWLFTRDKEDLAVTEDENNEE